MKNGGYGERWDKIGTDMHKPGLNRRSGSAPGQTRHTGLNVVCYTAFTFAAKHAAATFSRWRTQQVTQLRSAAYETPSPDNNLRACLISF
jgi:hypothetical protein